MIALFKHLFCVFLIPLTLTCCGQSTDTIAARIQNIPYKYYSKVQTKYTAINKNLSKKSIKYLKKLQKQEDRINRKLSSIDSLSGKANDAVTKKYASFIQEFKEKKEKLDKVNLNEYNSYIDTLSTSLSFLKKLGSEGKAALPLEKLDELKDKFNQTAKVNEFITERKQQIQQLLSKYTNLPGSLKRQFDKMRKTAYYYKAQVNEYKGMLKDPKKIEETAIKVLNKIPAFQKFMKQNSQIASLFALPEDYGTSASLAGLQTRASVQNLIQQRIASGGPNAIAQVRQNLSEAQVELSKLKDKLNKLGAGSGDLDMPDFKPNTQKTKPFIKRLEYSFDVQFSKSSSLLPNSADLALNLGYKLDSKKSFGAGISYNFGIGSIQHISFTSIGLGLRSYLDWKITKQFYASGGYEANYNAAFKNVEQLKEYSLWQRVFLIGISKKYQITKKTKGEIKILYDFLARNHIPATSPFLFRSGYSF